MAWLGKRKAGDGRILTTSLGGTRTEAMQRLQVGLLGLGAMLLSIGVATIVTDRANQAEEAVVPEAVQTSADPDSENPDPLADAGVVPDLPKQADENPLPDGPVLPEEGDAAADRPD